MATLDQMKRVLRQEAEKITSALAAPLSNSQYQAGFNIVKAGEKTTYAEFIIPQLCQLIEKLLSSRASVSVLEIGPGPETVLGSLPAEMRRKIHRYVALEPNGLFVTALQEQLLRDSNEDSPLPCLGGPPGIKQLAFGLDEQVSVDASNGGGGETFDIVLFCHSMYGMRPKRAFVEHALGILTEHSGGGLVVVFHRDGLFKVKDLVCKHTALYPTGTMSVANDDCVLDTLSRFVAGLVVQDVEAEKAVRGEWRNVCRTLGGSEGAHPDKLFFSSPNIMTVFTQLATTLPELAAQSPIATGEIVVKNREARTHHPASIVMPKSVEHVQQCVRFALDRGVSLTVLGGGHSGQCLWPNVIAVDMSAFDQIDIVWSGRKEETVGFSNSRVVVGAGCKTGDIISKTMAAGLTVPLGSRPSVGAGLWLQGGIGHLARQHGLACDAIVGAVMVSVASGQVLCVGDVPAKHRPAGAVQAENDSDLLWGIRGAGTNFGIIISVVFKPYVAPAYIVRNWVFPMSDSLEAQRRLRDFDELVAQKLPRHSSADAYLYWDEDKLQLGVNMHGCITPQLTTASTPAIQTGLGPPRSAQTVNGVGLFATEMYMSGMHGGHSSGKTSSFKRCVFLKDIGSIPVANSLLAAVQSRPSPRCYLHLLHGGGAVRDVAADATAFGCRDWDFACVVTGVWEREQDDSDVARSGVGWVYSVVEDLLPLGIGVYGADLGPDPRDAALAKRAFGPNLLRLSLLKQLHDPRNVLPYTCPLPTAPARQKLIVLVTGESCAGKDHSANAWVKCLERNGIAASSASISLSTKREYAAATGASLDRLLNDRVYKEQHRPALTTFFQDQVRLRPRLPEEHFRDVVRNAGNVDVLFITGMRDEYPLAAFSHLIPGSKMIEVRIEANETTIQDRGGCYSRDEDETMGDATESKNCPTLVFTNDAQGNSVADKFAKHRLLPLLHEDLLLLRSMVPIVPNFPRKGIEFRDILGISQQPGGLGLCVSLFQTHFTGDWAKIDAVVCCGVGGIPYASALAVRIDTPLALIREAGKRPPPTISVTKPTSYISSLASALPENKTIEMDWNAVRKGWSVVVVDDVLATGKTLCAVLELLMKAGVAAEDVTVMVIAEFPLHRGRELLRQKGFGGVKVQSLLVFDGE